MRYSFLLFLAFLISGSFSCAGSSSARRRVPVKKPPWYRDISNAKVAKNSKAIINWLKSQGGGWGRGRFQIDFSMHVLRADQSTPMRSFTPTEDHYTPDCDTAKVPLPAGGAIEGETGYRCYGDDDCHLLVYDSFRKRLYEMWRADLRGNNLRGGCLAVWDLKKRYGSSGRGRGCTSADAAGLPIIPLLANADEVARGEIRHALRFILPNPRIRRRSYVSPATHSTNATRGGVNAPAYGMRLRLRSDFPIQHLGSYGAKVIARALQDYGMFLADGGDITLTVQSDRFTKSKWKGVLGAHDLGMLKITDFEVVEYDPLQTFDGNCTRRR